MNATTVAPKTTQSGSANAVQLRQIAAEKFADELKLRVVLSRGSMQSNCMGTAMFLIGEQKEDRYLDICCRQREMLDRMIQLPKPTRASIAVWYKNAPEFMIEHMGVIVSVDPILVTHRTGCDDEFIENEPFLDIDPRYRAGREGRDVKLAFYLPRSCENLSFEGISLIAEVSEQDHFLGKLLKKILR